MCTVLLPPGVNPVAVNKYNYIYLTYLSTPWSRILLEKPTCCLWVSTHLQLTNISISVLLTYLLTYLPTPWSRILLEKPTGSQLVKKLPTYYGTRRIITAFTSARHQSLTWASPVNTSTSRFLNIRLNIILPSTLVSPKWICSLRFPHQNPVYASPIPHTRYMLRPSHSPRFYHPNNIGWGVQIIKLLIMYSST